MGHYSKLAELITDSLEESIEKVSVCVKDADRCRQRKGTEMGTERGPG